MAPTVRCSNQVGANSRKALCIVVATAALLACANIGSAPASGSSFELFRKAVWRATLTGTFHSEGQLTNYRRASRARPPCGTARNWTRTQRSEEHTSELQSP